MKKVHEAFKEWQVATVNYPNQMRLRSLNGLERDLRDFQVKIRELSMDTDQRLRGRRAPDGLSEVVAPRGSVSSEIARLAEAHRTLLIDLRTTSGGRRAPRWSGASTCFTTITKG